MAVDRLEGDASSFLLTTASRTPRRINCCNAFWNSTKASPSLSWPPSRSDSQPSSPTTPPQSVLSRSTMTNLRAPPRTAVSAAATSSAARSNTRSSKGTLPMNHIRSL